MQELARRFDVQRVPDAAAQMRAGATRGITGSADYQFAPEGEPAPQQGFWDSAKQAVQGINPVAIAHNYVEHMSHPYETATTTKDDPMGLIPATPVIHAVDQASTGNVGGALGTVAGTAAQFAIPAALAKGVPRVAGKMVSTLPDSVLPRSGSPVQRAAVDWALENNAPLDAAAATLNPLVRSAQEMAQTTPGASSAAQKAIQARNEWYAAKGRSLAADVYPTPQTPETVGRAIADQGVQTIRSQNSLAGDQYAALRDRELDPKNSRDVVTGTEPKTVQLQTGTKQVPVPGVVGLDGKPAMQDAPVIENVSRDMPVTEKIPFPVDMRTYKAQFAPVLEQLQRQTRLGQSQYAPAQLAVEDLVNGPDYVPASVAEKNLGALKDVVRKNTLTGGVTNDAGQLATQSVDRLQGDIDATVKQIGGADALNELHAGRLATHGKYAAIDLVDQFKAEPVKLYDQLAAKRDAGINLLSQVQKLAPEQMPALGRAWLDGAMDKATEEGGINHANKLFADWQNLGDQTKQVIFKNPAMISDLNHFFQSMKDSSRVENPSGTARVAHFTGTAGFVFANPAVGVPYVVGMNAISRLLYSPRFVRAAIGAMKATEGSPGAAAAASNLAAAAGSAAKPLSSVPATTDGLSTNDAPSAQAQTGGNYAEQAGQAAIGETRAPVEQSGSSAGTGAQAASGQRSPHTVVEIAGKPGGGYQAEYRVSELKDLKASHNFLTFQPNPEFPLKNTRRYEDPVNQAVAIKGASPDNFQSKLVTGHSMDALNGTVGTDEAGNVLWGANRYGIQQRVWAGNPKGQAQLRADIAAQLSEMGKDPSPAYTLDQPILHRMIRDEEFAKRGPNAKQDAIADTNVPFTKRMTQSEQIMEDSRRVSPGTLDHIAARLDEHGANATLADVLQGKPGGEILNKLIDDGVVSSGERGALQESEGSLTDEGKDRISNLVLGRFFGDTAQLKTIAPTIRNQVERIAAPLAQVESKSGWSLTPHVKQALDILEQAQKLKYKSVDEFLAHDSLFGAAKYGPESVTLARALKTMSAGEIKAAARQYAQDAAYAAKGSNTLLGDAPTPESSFADAFGKPKTNALAPK